MGGIEQMSYSTHHNASVHYSGSVSYPASEHGGSVHYSGTVPVSITIHVNTNPFDGSVSNFNRSVDVLTGSVVAMKAAQCTAINQTATDVSTSLINGFFGTIKTELSQQLQALDSAIKATYGLLLEQGKAITEKKNVMEGDYNRIASRYVRLFADLDNECYKRIYALDKQSFLLAEKVQRELVGDTSKNAAALNLLGIEETASSKSLLLISSLNRKVLEVLKTLHDYITQESRINSLVNSFLVNEEAGENIPYYAPVVFTESDMLEGDSAKQEDFVPVYLDERKRQAVADKAREFRSGVSPSAWKGIAEQEKEAVNKEFNALAESSFAGSNDENEQRIYQTMLSLWKNSNLSVIERSE
jgi:hypothetical protein